MKASDTVLSDEQIYQMSKGRDDWDDVGNLVVAKAQAEATWAARESEIEQAEKRGMRKVIEWIEVAKSTAYIYEGVYTYDTHCDNQMFIDLGDYEAQLKTWGMREVK